MTTAPQIGMLAVYNDGRNWCRGVIETAGFSTLTIRCIDTGTRTDQHRLGVYSLPEFLRGDRCFSRRASLHFIRPFEEGNKWSEETEVHFGRRQIGKVFFSKLERDSEVG